MKYIFSRKQLLLGGGTSVALVLILAGLVLFGRGSNQAIDTGNRYYAGPFQVFVTIDPEQPRVGKNRLRIDLLDKNDRPVGDARVKAVAEMPSMGSMPVMRAPASIEQTKKGSYRGEFELLMTGAWPLTLDIMSAKKGKASLTFDLTTSRSGLRLMSATPSSIAPLSADSNELPTSASQEREETPGTIRMGAKRRQLIGVTTGIAEERILVKTIRAAGRVTYDETRLTDITLKFNGWIGKLWANSVGASVRKGRPLFSIYSPELVSAQQEYLEILRRRKDRNDSLLIAARQRLKLWDISPAQIRDLEKRNKPKKDMPILSPVTGTVIEKNVVAGSAVKTGMRLMRIADLSNVWVEGQIYEYEIEHVKQGMDAEVVLPDYGGRRLPAKVAYVYPYLEGDTRTARVRVVLDNKDGLLRPEMYAHVHLKIDLGKRLVVPEGAVLYAGNSRIVFVDLGKGQLQPRKVKTGVRNNDVIEVLEGLSIGDKVVTSGNFLIAAESKLKSGIDQW
ncbi:MAG: efflux RND transporter periplasmic adaptor subunit [Acidiferrobacterales bacterium]